MSRPKRPRLILYGYRWCFRCNGWKPKDRFSPRENSCRDCLSGKAKRQYRAIPEDQKWAYTRNVALKHQYGITLEDYYRMWFSQGGRCAACGCYTDLVVDHDHSTGAVRALLCGGCNSAEGHLASSPERAEALAAYMRRYATPSERGVAV